MYWYTGLLAFTGLWYAQGYKLAPCARERPRPLRLCICSSRRVGVCMGLEFPRREVQQSREYNVARVRGGYYLSDKDGDAPLEEVIRSKTADVGAQEVDAGVELTTDFVAASKYMPSLDAGDPIVKAQILKSAMYSLE